LQTNRRLDNGCAVTFGTSGLNTKYAKALIFLAINLKLPMTTSATAHPFHDKPPEIEDEIRQGGIEPPTCSL